MEQSTLGKLPEGFSQLAKFRPADQLDFSRRAKNLAKILLLPLQDAQRVLARAYGYADLHELQQVLKEPGASGPYQDQLEAFIEGDGALRYQLRFYRHNRLMRSLMDTRDPSRSDECVNREAFACDLGLFCSPTAHRAAMKAVVEFLTVGQRFTEDGFPFGFNGVLHSRYSLWNFRFDEDAFKVFGKAPGFPFQPDAVRNPSELLRMLRRYRASHLFIEMVQRASPELLESEHEIDLDVDETGDTEAELLLQHDFNADIRSHLLVEFEAKHGVDLDWSGRDASKLALAICEPTDSNVQASEIATEIPDFRGRLAEWRLSLRLQWAQQFASGEFDDYYDIEGAPTLLTAGDSLSSLFLLMEKQDTYDSFQHWRMSGTVLRRDSEDATWMPVGVIIGDYLLPASDGLYSPPERVRDHFDEHGDDELYRVWHLLQTTYVPRAGYENYGEWVNDDDGSALANVHYWGPVAESTPDARPLALQLLLRAFQEGYSDSWDGTWRRFGRPDEHYLYSDEIDESVYDFPYIGVVFLPQPGTGNLGYAIWDGQHDEATLQVLRSGGERQGRGSRRYTFVKPERTGPIWDLLESVKSLPADFVLYDPTESISDTN